MPKSDSDKSKANYKRSDVLKWLNTRFAKFPNAAYRETVFDLMWEFDLSKQAASDYACDFMGMETSNV